MLHRFDQLLAAAAVACFGDGPVFCLSPEEFSDGIRPRNAIRPGCEPAEISNLGNEQHRCQGLDTFEGRSFFTLGA